MSPIENAQFEPRIAYRGRLTFNECAERIKAQMRREHRELHHPDGDVAPRVFFYVGERMFEKQLEPEWFSSRDTKDYLTEQIVKMIRVLPVLDRIAPGGPSGASYVGLVYGQLRSTANLDDLTDAQREALMRNEIPDGILPPLEDPNAEEILAVTVLDAEILKAWHAPILRHRKNPPRLGAWETLTDIGWLPAGLMIDPIREALR